MGSMEADGPVRATSRVMCIGRSDCLGNSGIQGDIKTVTALGGIATGVVTIVTAGNAEPRYVMAEVSPTVVVGQIESIAQCAGLDAVKVGLLLSQEQVDIVASALDSVAPLAPRILSPALIDESGRLLLTQRAIAAWKRRLIVNDTILVAVLHEAEILTGMEIRDDDSMAHAAQMMLTFGSRAVFIHGGGFRGDHGVDMLATETELVTFEDGVSDTKTIFGLKSGYGASIAAQIAKGDTVRAAVETARAFVKFGADNPVRMANGHLCLHHAHTFAD